MDSCYYFTLKQGLYGKQVSDEKIIYGLINGVKGAIRPVIAMIRCKVPLTLIGLGGGIFAPGFLKFKMKPHLTTHTPLKYLSKLIIFGFSCFTIVVDA